MHGFGFQIDLKVLETFLKASTEKFCQIIWVTFFTLWFHEFFQLLFKKDKHKKNSVKSSCEVHWIVMFQKDAVCFGSKGLTEHYALDIDMYYYITSRPRTSDLFSSCLLFVLFILLKAIDYSCTTLLVMFVPIQVLLPILHW